MGVCCEGVKGATADIRLFSLSPCRLRRGEIPAQCCQSIQKEYKDTTAQFGGASGDVFSAICIMQISRFTASKPSKFAFASDEKSIRQPTTSFVRCYLNLDWNNTLQQQISYSAKYICDNVIDITNSLMQEERRNVLPEYSAH